MWSIFDYLSFQIPKPKIQEREKKKLLLELGLLRGSCASRDYNLQIIGCQLWILVYQVNNYYQNDTPIVNGVLWP